MTQVLLKGVGKPSLYALGLVNFATYRYAQEFHAAAKKTDSSLVRTYLLGHAIELYLKAFLLRSGLTISDLKKKFGHNLKKLLNEAKEKNIEKIVGISPQLVDDISKLNALYPETLRYFSLSCLFTQPQFPALNRLFRFATLLCKKLKSYVAVN